jgi:hypothetical protein
MALSTRRETSTSTLAPASDAKVLTKSTEELIVELQALVCGSPEQRSEILAAMQRLWNCADLNEVADQLVQFKGDIRVRRLLESAQWVFQSQDVADWPNRGRQRPLYAIERALNTPMKFDERRC